MRINGKGQVTIPKHIRERAGLMPGTDVDFALVDGEVRLRKLRPSSGPPTGGQKLVASLRSCGRYPMTTDDVIALMRGAPADEDTEGTPSPHR